MKRLFTSLSLFLFSFGLFAQDVALAPPGGNITSPTSGCAKTNAEVVTIRIFNYGPGTTVGNISVTYNITGPINSSATENIVAPNILQNGTYSYSFTTTADLSAEGVYNIDVSLVYAGDPNNTNDAFTGYSVEHYAASVGGTISGDGNVCFNNNSGNITLSGQTGSILNWEYSTDNGTTWFNISNTTTSQSYNNLTVETWYRAVVRNSPCSSTTSSIGVMLIDPTTVAGTVSGPNSVCSGSNINLTKGAGTGSVDHWEYSTDGGTTWTTVANTTNNYTFINATMDIQFRAFVISGTCPGLYTNTKSVTVSPPTVGGSVTNDATECSGNNSGTLTLAGHTGTILRWQFSIDGGSTWTNIANTTTTQNYTNLTQTTMYRAIVKSGTCSAVGSIPATITIVSASNGGAVTSDVTECKGMNNDTLLLAGESGTILNWEFSIDGGSTWTPIANTTNQEIYSNLTVTTMYRAAVQNGSCPIGYSNPATITVDSLSEGGNTSGAGTYCSGSNSGNVDIANNVGNILQWESSIDGGTTWDTIINTSSTNSYLNLTGTTIYRVAVQSGVCPVDYSDTVMISIDSVTIGGSVLSNMSVCSGNNTDTLNLSGERGSVLNWELSTDGGFSWSTLVNTTTQQIFNNITTSTQYRAHVQNGVCPSGYSAPALITVDPATIGGNIIGGTTVCSSGNSGALTLVGHATNVVQWESSTDGGVTWNIIANTSAVENYSNLTQTTAYRSIVSSGGCPNDTSSLGIVTVDTITVPGMVTSDDTLCANSVGDTLNLTGNNGSILNWEISSDGGSTWITLSNTTNQQIYNNLLVTTMFRSRVKNGVCPADVSNSATITINAESNGGVVNSNATGCEGYNSGTMVLTGYEGSIVDWEFSNDNSSWISLSDTTDNISYINLTDTTYFHAIVQSGNCGADTSSVAYVTVYPKPLADFVSDTVCEGAPINFINSSTILNGFITLYNWDFGDNNSQIVTNPTHIYADSGSYNVSLVAMSNFGCLDTAIINATVHPLPESTITPVGVTTFCEGDSVLLSVPFITDHIYLWNTGETVNFVLADTTGNFSIVVTDTITGCTNMDSVIVTVFSSPIANAGPDTTISIGMSYEMMGSGGLIYNWSPGATLNDSTIAQAMATPVVTTTYYLTVSDINGCTDLDTMIITLDDNVAFDIPNLITPNGDGFNDTWIIPNILSFPDNSITIFNRNGQIVFDMTGYDNTWDGKFNGNTLPDGTYYFVLEIDGAADVAKGSINILSSDR